jgi:hypothetical protein
VELRERANFLLTEKTSPIVSVAVKLVIEPKVTIAEKFEIAFTFTATADIRLEIRVGMLPVSIYEY